MSPKSFEYLGAGGGSSLCLKFLQKKAASCVHRKDPDSGDTISLHFTTRLLFETQFFILQYKYGSVTDHY